MIFYVVAITFTMSMYFYIIRKQRKAIFIEKKIFFFVFKASMADDSVALQ